MVFEICAILLTIGILIFLIYAIIALRKSTAFLNKVGPDLEELLQDSHYIAEDLKEKLDNLSPTFRLMNGISATAEEGFDALKRRSFINMTGSFINVDRPEKSQYAEEITEGIFKIVELATLVVALWRKRK